MKFLKGSLFPIILAISILLSSCGSGDTAKLPDETTAATVDDTTVGDTIVGDTTAADPVPVEPKIYDHVLIIGVDGAGAYFKDTDTPNMDRIFKDGNITHEARTGVPAVSAHSWTSLLHGVEYAKHQISNGIAEEVPYPIDSEYPSIFRVLHEQDPDAKMASICRWPAQNIGIVEDGIGVYKVTEKESDLKVAESVCKYLEENGAPKLMYTVFDDADVAGHSKTWGSPEHLRSITNIDALIGMIYDSYEALGVLDSTLIMVTADHGGFERDHGGNMDSEKLITFAITGESVIKNGAAEDMSIRDVAAITAYALGLEAPESWTARIPAGIFEGVGGGERPVYVSESNTRYRECKVTPKKFSSGYINNYITKELRYYLPFDGDTEDICDNEVIATDDFFFVEGVYGDGMWFDNGYLTIPNYSTGGEGFTIAMWLKIEGLFTETPIITNKDTTNPENKGFSISLHGTQPQLIVTIGDGNITDQRTFKLPADYRDGWVHVIFAYSPEEGRVKLSYDFGKFNNMTLNKEMSKDALEGVLSSLRMGFELAGNNPHAFNGAIDDFMQFDGCFTSEDVAALAAYYGK